MKNSCEICGADCDNNVCSTCQYQIESGDRSDIWGRVQAFDNSEYEIDQLRATISSFFGVEDIFKSGRRQPWIEGKHLFIYFLKRHFNLRSADICRKYGVRHDNTNYITKKYDERIKSKMFQKKYQRIINCINFTIARP